LTCSPFFSIFLTGGAFLFRDSRTDSYLIRFSDSAMFLLDRMAKMPAIKKMKIVKTRIIGFNKMCGLIFMREIPGFEFVK